MKLSRTYLALAGAAALVAIGGVAYAGPPWTVSVDGSSTGSSASYTASTVGAGSDIEWSVPAANLTCASGTADGTITSGATASTAGEITSTMFDSCLWAFGIQLEVTQTSVWDVNITSDNVGGVTLASIGNVNAHVENPNGLCEFDITGSVPATFDEYSQQLHVDGGGLTISNVSGCFGGFGNGNPMTFKATYQLADIAPVTITN